jgi:two-component system response regulator CpxR
LLFSSSLLRAQPPPPVPETPVGRGIRELPRGDCVPANQQPLLEGLFARPAATAPSGRSEIRMRPKKVILCVDDNEQMLSVRTFLLETRGYRVLPELSSHDALERVQQAAPGSIDLLLCDLIMPQMDGNELVRRAKQLHPGLPAMIVSGTVNSADRAICADVFLPKGACSPIEMLERIRVLVARKRGPRKAPMSQPAYIPMMTVAAAS